MDQQNTNPTPKHVPTEAEIARLEAEAVAALQRGEPIPRRVMPTEAAAPEAEAPAEAPAQPSPANDGFVPYVDDVPEPAAPKKDDAADADDDDDDEEYIPSEWEKRIDALDPKQWRLWQIAGGATVGAVVVASLFIFGEELSSYGLILAALLAILLPRYLERSWRRKLTVARNAMLITMVIGLTIAFVIVGVRNGFVFTKQK